MTGLKQFHRLATVAIFLSLAMTVKAQDAETIDKVGDEGIRAACHSYMVDALPNSLSWLRDQIYEGSPFCAKVNEAYDYEALGEVIETEYKRARRGSDIDWSKKHDRDLNITIECDGEIMCIESRGKFLGTKTPVSQKQYDAVYAYCGKRYGCTQAFFENWPRDIPTPAVKADSPATSSGIGFARLIGDTPANTEATEQESQTRNNAPASFSSLLDANQEYVSFASQLKTKDEIVAWLKKNFDPVAPLSSLLRSCGGLPAGWQPPSGDSKKDAIRSMFYNNSSRGLQEQARKLDAYADCVERFIAVYDVRPYAEIYPQIREIIKRWQALGGELVTDEHVPSDGFIIYYASPEPADALLTLEQRLIKASHPNALVRTAAARDSRWRAEKRRKAAMERKRQLERNRAAVQQVIQSYSNTSGAGSSGATNSGSTINYNLQRNPTPPPQPSGKNPCEIYKNHFCAPLVDAPRPDPVQGRGGGEGKASQR